MSNKKPEPFRLKRNNDSWAGVGLHPDPPTMMQNCMTGKTDPTHLAKLRRQAASLRDLGDRK